MEIKETSVVNLHKSHGAKLVEFAGYNMPIQYSEGILNEHKFTRSNCGIFDVSHMGQLFIDGEIDLTKDLEKIFPIDLQSLKTNQSKYSFLMNDNGGIYDDLRFMHGGEFKFNNLNIYITRSGYTGEDGFEISIPNEIAESFTKTLLDNGSKLIGLGARDTLRMEAGLCLYGNDINAETTPIEANLKWAISKNRIDDHYPGSKIIKKQIESGVNKLRVGIKPDTKVIARANTKIFIEVNK